MSLPWQRFSDYLYYLKQLIIIIIIIIIIIKFSYIYIYNTL